MASAARDKRMDMRVDEDTKLLAERATAAAGFGSVTDFVTSLIRENAPKILEQQANIEVTNQQFDQFMAVCMDTTQTPSTRILKAAERLDREGF